MKIIQTKAQNSSYGLTQRHVPVYVCVGGAWHRTSCSERCLLAIIAGAWAILMAQVNAPYWPNVIIPVERYMQTRLGQESGSEPANTTTHANTEHSQPNSCNNSSKHNGNIKWQ